MISFISGTVTEVTENSLTIECCGIGYEIFASSKTLDKKGRVGEKTTIFTHLNVREDGITLFGFHSTQEKSMFTKLINVNGIGAKVALSILSGISIEDLISSITTSDFSRLSQIKGIGKKTAERIVLELKDKVSADGIIINSQATTQPTDQDAVLALVSMGYTKQEAQNKIAKVYKEGLSTETLIINALKS